MTDENSLVLRPQKAQAFGRPMPNGFLARKGSTAMVIGSPLVKRDHDIRDRLVRQGVLPPDSAPNLFRFSRDHVFDGSRAAGGVVTDGNCSGLRVGEMLPGEGWTTL